MLHCHRFQCLCTGYNDIDAPLSMAFASYMMAFEARGVTMGPVGRKVLTAVLLVVAFGHVAVASAQRADGPQASTTIYYVVAGCILLWVWWLWRKRDA
jgi:hypothetical protein